MGGRGRGNLPTEAEAHPGARWDSWRVLQVVP